MESGRDRFGAARSDEEIGFVESSVSASQ